MITRRANDGDGLAFPLRIKASTETKCVKNGPITVYAKVGRFSDIKYQVIENFPDSWTAADKAANIAPSYVVKIAFAATILRLLRK